MLEKKAFPQNYTNITRNHLYQIFFYEVARLELIESPAQVFSCEFCEIFQKSILQKNSERLPLDIERY